MSAAADRPSPVSAPPTLHASCVSWRGHGVLICGAPGAGKSTLALGLMEAGFDLVADDRVIVEDSLASAPARLAGMIEVRGVGLLRVPFVTNARVLLRVRLGGPQPRLPEPERDPLTGAVLLSLEPGFPAIVLRVRAALMACCGVYGWIAGAGGDATRSGRESS